MVISRRGAAVLLAAVPLLAGESLTTEERESLIEQLEISAKEFEASIADVPAKEWNQKPAPDQWSVAEVAEHIGLSEDVIFGIVRNKVLKSPEQPSTPEDRAWDAKIRSILLDRSRKAQAPETLKPVKRWPAKEALLKDFRESRARVIEYVRTTSDPLRSHRAPHPILKTMDGYQWLLLLSGHTERHTLQIEEVKAALKQ